MNKLAFKLLDTLASGSVIARLVDDEGSIDFAVDGQPIDLERNEFVETERALNTLENFALVDIAETVESWCAACETRKYIITERGLAVAALPDGVRALTMESFRYTRHKIDHIRDQAARAEDAENRSFRAYLESVIAGK